MGRGIMQIRPSIIAIVALGISAATSGAAEPFIAGVDPSVRPAGAPVVTTYVKDGAWYQRALTGVSAPYPYSLRFLEDQGAWFTPFIHPGMTGPYDIRGWHKGG